MEQLTARLVEFWNSLGVWQRMVVIGIPAVLIIAAIATMTILVGAPPASSILYKDVEASDAQLIIDELNKDNIPYDLLNDGRDIAVPASAVHRVRIKLASMGLPRGHVGFELFDEAKMGITDQGMRIDKQRALQGELGRNLEALEQVVEARVILAIAPETSFLDTDTKSTASVMLKLDQGGRLTEAQVEGIRHLVSRAVPRLVPDDVSITDSMANPLTGREDSEAEQRIAGMELAELQHELRQRLERRAEDKIRRLLEGPYGVGNVAPSVTMVIDFTTMSRQTKEYSPVTSDEQGIESRVEEHRTRSNAQEEDLGGIPGSTSNVPGYLGINQGDSTGTESSSYDLMVDYLVNEEFTEEDLPPGVVTGVSAAVTVNTDADGWPPETRMAVEDLVASAIGADIDAGDEVTVQAFLWKDDSAAAVGQITYLSGRSSNINTAIKIGATVILVGFVLFLLRGLVFGGMPRESMLPTPAPERSKDLADMTEEEAEEYALKRLDELGSTQQDKMRQEISRMVETEPDRVVALLRSWLLEDT